MDYLSKLPDDIIIGHILPVVDLKQRIRSSLLSRRWRNLWRYTRTLVFPHGLEPWEKSYPGCYFKNEDLENNRKKYVNWVTSTLGSLAGPELDCFSVCYDLDSRFSGAVDSWLLHAIRLGVKKLYLHLGLFEDRKPSDEFKEYADKFRRRIPSDAQLVLF